ncbi:GT4 family glycosyltransferase PelF [uncultured Cohaesibacter sp.]|uniref:GT4 family glycosyltransferase PelF n=1 Tax=uncultured Cohaesibacter sp. TaxID=1002546 RepID=UPI0029317383|nr:GT4 family glycosyltransferase PelF [uncultured Cohaesibacter sp.]
MALMENKKNKQKSVLVRRSHQRAADEAGDPKIAKWHAIANKDAKADICLIVEGCYPFVRGGVSTWLDWLMRNQPDLTFSVFAIFPFSDFRKAHYEVPDNLVSFHQLGLQDLGKESSFGHKIDNKSVKQLHEEMTTDLLNLFDVGGLEDFSRLNAAIQDPASGIPKSGFMNSPFAWHLINSLYERKMPQASFLHFFWAARVLLGGMFAIMQSDIPRADLYHTISTGYAGLLAARAKLEMKNPVLISEHGIYSNERRIEILMADWIADTVDTGLSLQDKRFDLRDLWLRAFDSYGRTCYQACDEITTLFEGNQRIQEYLGAPTDRMHVIANGIKFENFSSLEKQEGHPPTIALVGRVVPIKDIKTFLRAVSIARKSIDDLSALIMGPTDEDEDYFEECRLLVGELDLESCLTFTGNVKLTDYFPQTDLIVLSSLSEAQPLVLLEAGAAAIPCIATDVGSCREIIEGRSDETPAIGAGGIVTGLVDAVSIARAIVELLTDSEKRIALGKTLQTRVDRYYRSEQSAQNYKALYARHGITSAQSDPIGDPREQDR